MWTTGCVIPLENLCLAPEAGSILMTCCCGPVRLVHNTSRYFIYGNNYVPSVASDGKQCVQNGEREVKNATEKGKEIPGLRMVKNRAFCFNCMQI